jgi:predicted AlkP superfamily pyrophosphatase or phosphodiesterase
MYVQMLNHVIRTHRPNVALLHLVEVDHVEHAKGPQTPEAYAAVKFADDRVREVWDELKKSFPGKATLVVASDHGFLPYQQQIQPNVLLRNEGWLTTEGTKITGGKVRMLGQGGAAFIYVLDSPDRDAVIERLAGQFRDIEGIEVVITRKDFSKYGLADPRQNPQMGDLVLSAKEGYSFSDSLAGNLVVTPKSEAVKGAHGYDPNHPALHGTFIAWGAGIKSGSRHGAMNNTDVAPTMAALLGLKIPDADGQALEGILAR